MQLLSRGRDHRILEVGQELCAEVGDGV